MSRDKRFIYILLVLVVSIAFSSNSFSQGFKVKEFRQNMSDGSAFHAPMDSEGHPCGLIKVRTDDGELKFKGNIVGEVDNKTNEYWVYMAQGSKSLNILHPAFMPLLINFDDYNIGEVASKATYILTLSEQKYNKEKCGLVAIVKPETAALYIDEIFIENLSGNGLYQLYLPKGGNAPYPLVIIGHGFGVNMLFSAEYAEDFAQNGIAAYAFDFVGGGHNIKSSGNMTDMSVLTEAADMNTVLNGLAVRDDIDESNIFLMGESQGGFVASYVAGTRPKDVRGLIALCPAYILQDDAWRRTPDPKHIPERMHVMGTTIGRIYNADAMSFDIYDVIARYDGPTLLIHGTADGIVPIAYSRRAVKVFPDAELLEIAGAGHGFYGEDDRLATKKAIEHVLKHTVQQMD